MQIIVTDSVGLEGAYSDSIADRRFGKELNPTVTGHDAGMAQLEWLESLLQRPRHTTWRILMGHRPVISNSQRFRKCVTPTRIRSMRAELLARPDLCGGSKSPQCTPVHPKCHR